MQSKEKVMKSTIDMAREAGIDAWWDSGSDWRETFDEHLKAFEALVRADEREACAKVCDRVIEGKDPDDIHSDSQWAALSLAAEIRARGNT
jgi:hypothetical protein